MSRRMLLNFALVVALMIPMAVTAQELTGLQRRVQHELVMLPYYSAFDWLQFKVDGNKVTLIGEVTRPTLKSDAEDVVKRIESVSEVVNEIEVLPVSPNDDRVRLAVYRAVYYHPNFTRYAIRSVGPIHILVKNGDVRLLGVVDTEADKNVAGIQANGVAGVFSVTNDLTVEK